MQALIRWDPVGHAQRELAEREELGFPPAVRMAAVSGSAAAVEELLGRVGLPDSAEVLGPVPDEQAAASQGGSSQGGPSLDGPPQDHETESADTPVRALIRVPRAEGSALARALQSAQAARSPRKDAGVARVQLDPAELI